jgi:dihydropteroate synthase
MSEHARDYVLPTGLLQDRDAVEAIADGRAQPLAGGPAAFTHARIIRRAADGGRTVETVAARDLDPDRLARLVAPRPPVAGLALAGLKLDAPRIMGIVNVTPDSFSDGGAHLDPAAAIAHGKALIAGGADILDIGGESTRPDAQAVAVEEEIARVLPVVEGLKDAGAPLSIDTRNAATMRAAVAAGATIVNDVSALAHDPGSAAAVATLGVPVILMHMKGEPATMRAHAVYDDVVLDVYDALEARIAAAWAAGIAADNILVDPGFGFAKKPAQNLALLEDLAILHGLGVPVVSGTSRKSFIAAVVRGTRPSERIGFSLATALAAVARGAHIVRVHDVAETRQALAVAVALAESAQA